MKFRATDVEYWSQPEFETVFLGNAEKELALTISGAAGEGGHYFEWNDQSNACSNAVKSAKLAGRVLTIRLLAAAAKKLGVKAFEIGIESHLDEVTDRLVAILGDRIVVEAGPAPKKKSAPAKDYAAIRYLSLERKNLKELPDYVREMTSLETAMLAGNPKLDFGAVCEVLSKLPVKELSFTTDQPIPENLGALRQLESLTLDGFTTPKVLPESMGQMRNLRSLLILGDSDVVLPEALAELENLNDLRIRVPNCQLPSRFYKWSKLTDLDLSNCRFTRLPEEMAGMTAITSLMLGGRDKRDYAQVFGVAGRMPNLETLELVLSRIPDGIEACRNIKTLSIWAGPGERIQWPEGLFTLTQLKSLILHGGRFEAVPEGIGRLSGLETLVIAESDFESLPESIGELPKLTYLNVSENPSFRQLPKNLSKLKTLTLEDNPRLNVTS